MRQLSQNRIASTMTTTQESLLETLKKDYLAAYAHKPKFSDLAFAFLFKPEFASVTYIRICAVCHSKRGLLRVAGRLLWLRSQSKYSCHISPRASIGAGLRLPHPTGIVIGSGAVIGSNATIYQNVTVGTRDERAETYPTIGNHVLMGAGCMLLGGITVGDYAKIGAGAIVVKDIPPKATALGQVAKVSTGNE